MKLRSRTSQASSAPKPKKQRQEDQKDEKVKTGNDTKQSAAADLNNETDFLLRCFDAVDDAGRKEDFIALHHMIRKFAPNLAPTTEFSHGLIGYGKYDYKYKSGREGTWAKITLANNKQNMALHCCGLLKDGRHVVESMKDKLGKCSTGKSCVRFKRLSDLNRAGLEDLIAAMATCEILLQ